MVTPAVVPVAAVLVNRTSCLTLVPLLKVCVFVPISQRLLLLWSVLPPVPVCPAVYPVQFLLSSCVSCPVPVCPAVYPVSSCLFQS